MSVVKRPDFRMVAYASSDIIELAAKYTAGILQNHPFVDGNKRTGFVVGVLFLELNGYRFWSSQHFVDTLTGHSKPPGGLPSVQAVHPMGYTAHLPIHQGPSPSLRHKGDV